MRGNKLDDKISKLLLVNKFYINITCHSIISFYGNWCNRDAQVAIFNIINRLILSRDKSLRKERVRS